MKETIITVQEAKAILSAQQFEPMVTQIRLAAAIGSVLADDLYALVDIPAVDQSSMDGYAFAFDSWKSGTAMKVTGRIAAESDERIMVKEGEAVRVFTGAPLPEGADTVVMQERTVYRDGFVTIDQADLRKGDNRRIKGTDIKKDTRALAKNALVTAASVGFLGALGYAKIPVYATPSVAIVITGNELQKPGLPLVFGQVYEASSAMLQACLAEMGIADVTVYFVKDELDETVKVLNDALRSSDVVLITGGVSVGDYDFVVKAAEQCGIQQLFHKVKQRPGKPLYAGRKGAQPVFGLPGNPSSVLTCFYEYVWPLLRKMKGQPDNLTNLQVPLAETYQKNNQLTHFLKGNYQDGKATILTAQESYRLSSFAVANCFVILDEIMRVYEKGEIVEIHLLPVYG